MRIAFRSSFFVREMPFGKEHDSIPTCEERRLIQQFFIP